MGCPQGAHQCRSDIALKLGEPEPAGSDWEARCPVCRHSSFRISAPKVRAYRHIWTCACKRCRCDPATIRAALLGLGVLPGCLGSYGASGRPAAFDPVAVALLEQTVDDILNAPHLKPADMRIALAEARGHKRPDERKAFVKWAMGIGVGRSQAYEAADRWCCRPSDCPPCREG